jgi:OOP family OmpA-OmpF porin
MLAIAVGGVLAASGSGCHVEGQAHVGGAPPPPPPPAPPPPASTTAEAPSPPPSPPAPHRKIIALKGVQMKSATQIDMPGDIEFQKASSKIVWNDRTQKVLTQLAQIMKDNPEITRLSVEGNTDNEGENTGFDNAKLSQQRAQSVVDWLTKSGVDSKRLSALGNGSKSPLAPNDTPDHMAQNRRVEFHVREFNGQSVANEEHRGSPAAGSSVAPAATAASATATTGSAAAGTSAAKKPAKKDDGASPAPAGVRSKPDDKDKPK